MTDCEKQVFEMQLCKAKEALEVVIDFLANIKTTELSEWQKEFGVKLKVENAINMLEA